MIMITNVELEDEPIKKFLTLFYDVVLKFLATATVQW